MEKDPLMRIEGEAREGTRAARLIQLDSKRANKWTVPVREGKKMIKEKDPILKMEEVVKEVHDRAGNLAQPVLKRYPLLFAFLLTFSAAAIIHGFEIWSDDIPLFREHPVALMVAGAVALGLTGTLYKALKKLD